MSNGRGQWFPVLMLVGVLTTSTWTGEAEPPLPEVKLFGPVFADALEAIGYTPATLGLDQATCLRRGNCRNITSLYRNMLADPLAIPMQAQSQRKVFFDCGLRGDSLLEKAAGLVDAGSSRALVSPTSASVDKTALATENVLGEALARLWAAVDMQEWAEPATKRPPLPTADALAAQCADAPRELVRAAAPVSAPQRA